MLWNHCGHWTVNHIWSEKRCAHAVVFKQDTSGTLNSNWKWCFGNTVPRVSVTYTWKINLKFNALKTLCSCAHCVLIPCSDCANEEKTEATSPEQREAQEEMAKEDGAEAEKHQPRSIANTGWLKGLQGTLPKVVALCVLSGFGNDSDYFVNDFWILVLCFHLSSFWLRAVR